ncbi:hypothetical protein QYF61_012625 [Mycteria americana]|uniref:Reverse transcriptase/retrotransposon-derived protein RNase H-like domain-containing protein n=1 Tax=Mycteria americana TaxID=33587 RepID=A0AAN7MJ36_MYCAM|nr:hypothetical protein QYF61_012625 [Mycteria americana]
MSYVQIHLSHSSLSSLIHLLVVLMFLSGLTPGYMSIYWEYSGPQILCIPDSKTLGVNLESPLVLSARGSSRQISLWMGIRESRLVRYCCWCTVVVALGTCCSSTLSNPTTEGSSERPGKDFAQQLISGSSQFAQDNQEDVGPPPSSLPFHRLEGARFCQPWIAAFEEMTKPLIQITAQDAGEPIHWTTEKVKTFKLLKQAAPALGLPDYGKPYTLLYMKGKE